MIFDVMQTYPKVATPCVTILAPGGTHQILVLVQFVSVLAWDRPPRPPALCRTGAVCCLKIDKLECWPLEVSVRLESVKLALVCENHSIRHACIPQSPAEISLGY